MQARARADTCNAWTFVLNRVIMRVRISSLHDSSESNIQGCRWQPHESVEQAFRRLCWACCAEKLRMHSMMFAGTHHFVKGSPSKVHKDADKATLPSTKCAP